MQGDLHVGFGKRQLRVILVVDFHQKVRQEAISKQYI